MWLIAALYGGLVWMVVADAIRSGEPRRTWCPEPRSPMRFVRFRYVTRGWAIEPVLALRAQPYDDLKPVNVFMVTRWRMRFTVLGYSISWNRFTKLDRYKSRISAWTGREYVRSRFYHGDLGMIA